MNRLLKLAAPLSFIIWISCTASKKIQPPADKTVLTIVGTMHRIEIEGGCWQFESETGESYELVGDQSRKLQVEGRRAKLQIKPRPDLASICMTGKIVEVIEILEVY